MAANSEHVQIMLALDKSTGHAQVLPAFKKGGAK